jgi:hypothetical protein
MPAAVAATSLRRPAHPLVACCVALVAHGGPAIAAQDTAGVRRIEWTDTAPLRPQLEARGITAAGFDGYVERVRQTTARRVREGDLDHLVFYILQSTRFTELPAIEPAWSAKGLVGSLPAGERDAFLKGGELAPPLVPQPVRARIQAFVRALDSRTPEPRLDYFRRLALAVFTDPGGREEALAAEYLRVMRFVYEKEFAGRADGRTDERVRELYRTRGLSTDTAVEAGFLVHAGLAIVTSLEPDRRIGRVLIVGPGMDLAPRTALMEEGPPESYQPWAVIDALLALGLAAGDSLEVVAADINPRVVAHLERAQADPPELTLFTELAERDGLTLSDDYHEYFAGLGRSIGRGASVAGGTSAGGHRHKTISVRPEVARTLRAERLDIVTERLDGAPFDLIIATNILPYFDDVELMLAMANVARMLAPEGVFLHNEPRPVLGDVTEALGLRFEQARQAVVARVRGAAAPLADSVFLHRKRATGKR